MTGSFSNLIDKAMKIREAKGEAKHGPLNLETDPRDFVDEGIEELIDCLNYLGWAMLQGKLPFCKWVSLDRDCRFMIWRLGKEDAWKASGMALETMKRGSIGHE